MPPEFSIETCAFWDRPIEKFLQFELLRDCSEWGKFLNFFLNWDLKFLPAECRKARNSIGRWGVQNGRTEGDRKWWCWSAEKRSGAEGVAWVRKFGNFMKFKKKCSQTDPSIEFLQKKIRSRILLVLNWIPIRNLWMCHNLFRDTFRTPSLSVKKYDTPSHLQRFFAKNVLEGSNFDGLSQTRLTILRHGTHSRRGHEAGPWLNFSQFYEVWPFGFFFIKRIVQGIPAKSFPKNFLVDIVGLL